MPENYREDSVLYRFVSDFTLRLALQRYPTADPLYLITDRLPLRSKQNAIVKGFKGCLAELAGGRHYEIGHHSSSGHPCLQAADYMNWAVYRKWENRDTRSYDLVRRFVKQEVRFDATLLERAKK